MKGYTHSLSAGAAWVAVTSTSTAALGITAQDPAVVIVGSLLCAGAGMWPDIDHHNGTIAWSLPPITRWLCGWVGDLSGGHRHATHSLFGIAVTALIGYAMSLFVIDVEGRSVAIGGGIMALLLTAFAVKVFGIGNGVASKKSMVGGVLGSPLGPWLIALTTAGLATWFMGYQWTWLTLALTLGAFVHCVGDALTIEGVPWLWPFNPKPPRLLSAVPVAGWVVKQVWMPNGYFRFPLLGQVGSLREKVFAVLLALYWLYMIVFEMMRVAGVSMLP